MEREGGCACGAVRYVAAGGPLRVGLCHCFTCRKRHGAPFNAFAAFRADKVRIEGETQVWTGAEHGLLHGCPVCGSPLFWTATDGDDDEIEIHLGGLDQIGQFTPQYEVWVKRREPWLPPLNVPNMWRTDRPACRPERAPARQKKAPSPWTRRLTIWIPALAGMSGPKP